MDWKIALFGAGTCLFALACDSEEPRIRVAELTSESAVLRARAAEVAELDVTKPAVVIERVVSERGSFGAPNLPLANAVAFRLSKCKLDCKEAFESLLGSESSDDRWIAYRAAMRMTPDEQKQLKPLFDAANKTAPSEDEEAIRTRVFAE